MDRGRPQHPDPPAPEWPMRARLASAVAPFVVMTIEALIPIFVELRNVPHALARNWRIYRARRRHG